MTDTPGGMSLDEFQSRRYTAYKFSITLLVEIDLKDWLGPAIPDRDIEEEIATYVLDKLKDEGILVNNLDGHRRGIKLISYEHREVHDALTACPSCGSEIYWTTLCDDSTDTFAMCTRCTWGED
jgi:predicted RNA-binding Zn-ribbon protein involved in translation (DUF1610 family)